MDGLDVHGHTRDRRAYRSSFPGSFSIVGTICHQTWDDWYNPLTGGDLVVPHSAASIGYHLSQNVARLIVLDC